MIPVNEPLVLEKDLEYVSDAIKTGWISSEGKYIKEFEKEFANYIGVKNAIAVNNGTNALILAVRALNLPKGSEIILPSMTIISCAMAIIYNDLIPVFVDSDKETWCINIKEIEKKITPKTKAIMPVHLYGHSVDMDELNRIAKKYNLIILEDFAEAIGTEYKGKKCGSFGLINSASFYANKVVTTGEGGICVTDDENYADELRKLRNLAFIPERRFVHYELGFNYRMTNVQAAIGLAQTQRIEEHVRKKILIGELYNNLLEDISKKGLIKLPPKKDWCKHTYWVYGIILSQDLKLNAQKMMKALLDKGVQTRPFFYPLHLQPAFRKFNWFKSDEKMPVSEELSEYGFYFPSGLTLTEKDITTVVKIFNEILNEII